MNDNNDDLQNAIDGIVNGADAKPVDKKDDAPVLTPDIDFGAAPVPPIGGDAPEMELPGTPEVKEEVVAPASTELKDIKKAMISDLIPLMDKVNLPAEKKFAFYKEIISEKHDKSMVPAAYEAAKGITDEATKAEALLYLIDEAE